MAAAGMDLEDIGMDMIEFENPSALDIALSEKVSGMLRSAIETDGKASLVVSGGRTPVGFFHLLSQQILDWTQVTITLADERWVDADHPDSNEKLVCENLLINEARSAHYLSLKNSAPTAEEGESACHRAFADMGRFTVVILGMGDDGHTASLFPGAQALEKGLDMTSGRNCVAVTPLHAPHQRMSLTLPRLLNSQQIILHISGPSKQQMLLRANSGTDSLELPIRAILQQQTTPVAIYWAH
ncbi:MAG: 6-phosphogluconolactonase [Porticoccaceae bacterium]|jgi:6-phosphogluconolactonase|nr:6-phosphogluconolactonase [Porticoccaceae bacterium]MDP4753319.1 6-phosphogluconolactonase [Porticoccaceae bacterium]MDP4890397.1 6-phosphogluconolactonase [Porticoccaceae bacterium]